MGTLNFEGGKVFITDDSGSPLALGKLHFYTIDTTTNKDTYTTSALSVANANPVILDAAGAGGDPWTIELPGAYGAGTAGKIIGDGDKNLKVGQFIALK